MEIDYINTKIANLESNLHIEIDMERIEDRSKALSYIGIEIADALKEIPVPPEQEIEETRPEVEAETIKDIKTYNVKVSLKDNKNYIFKNGKDFVDLTFKVEDVAISGVYYVEKGAKESIVFGELGFREGALKYNIIDNFGLTAEYLFNRNYISLEHYDSGDRPTYDPFDLHLASGGIFWNTAWMELASKVFFVTQTNYQTSMTFFHPLTKPVGTLPVGYVDASYQTITYGVRTFGWTTDVVFKPVNGLQIHALFTLQDPQYQSLVFTPEFKDGFKETFDMSGNTVTSVPKLILELNPSYTYKRFNVWASVRYSGRTMANMTNSLFHAGIWESFGGVGFKVNDKFSLTVNLTNFLNQKGAKGSIPSASLLRKEDVDASYENIPVVGYFVRPFTAEFSINFNL